MRILVDVLIVLSVPALIMEVQKVLAILGFYDQLDSRSAPNIFSVIHIQLVSWLDRGDLVASNPVLVLFHSFFPALEFLGLALLFFC